MKISLVKVHRSLALLLLVFIISHLAIHLTAIGGVNMHIKTLSWAHPLYTNMIMEPILIAAIIMQIIIGFMLLKKRWKQEQKGFWGWVQLSSGAYLGMFLIIHTSAALMTRYIVGLETNFHWAAGTLHIGNLAYYFAPYYFFAIFLIFSHLAAAIHFGMGDKARIISPMIMGAGALVALLIVTTFSGGFYEIQIPTEYQEYFNDF